MVDLATLTGGIIVGLGHEYAGLFSNDDDAGRRSCWRPARHGARSCGACRWATPTTSMIKSDIADMKNVGGRPGGSITAALFLQRFTNGVPWAHLDIAGTAWSQQGRADDPQGRDRVRRAPDRPPGRRALRELARRGVSEIGFYHLTRTTAEQALPKLLGRTLAAGQRAVVLCGSAARVQALDDALWAGADPDWLPHGSARTGEADLQPIWLATAARSPERRALPVPAGRGGAADPAAFDRVFDLFDGGDEAAVAAARARWTAAKAAGHQAHVLAAGRAGMAEARVRLSPVSPVRYTPGVGSGAAC